MQKTKHAALYIAYESSSTMIRQVPPERSIAGIVIASVSVIVTKESGDGFLKPKPSGSGFAAGGLLVAAAFFGASPVVASALGIRLGATVLLRSSEMRRFRVRVASAFLD